MAEDIERFAEALAKAGVPDGEPEPIEAVDAALRGRPRPDDRGRRSWDCRPTTSRIACAARRCLAGRSAPCWPAAAPCSGSCFRRALPTSPGPSWSRPTERPVTGTAGAALPGTTARCGALAFAAGRQARSPPGGEDRHGAGLGRRHGPGRAAAGGTSRRGDGGGLQRRWPAAAVGRPRSHSATVGRARRAGNCTCCAATPTRVRCVAVSADGTLALSGGDDRTVRVVGPGRRQGAAGLGWPWRQCDQRGPVGRWQAGSVGQPRSHGSAVGCRQRRARERGKDIRERSTAWRSRRMASGPCRAATIAWSACGTSAPARKLQRLRRTCQRRGLRSRSAPDGRRALSASSQYQTRDRILRVWDLDTGAEVARPGARPETSGRECRVSLRTASKALLSDAVGGVRLWWAPGQSRTGKD